MADLQLLMLQLFQIFCLAGTFRDSSVANTIGLYARFFVICKLLRKQSEWSDVINIMKFDKYKFKEQHSHLVRIMLIDKGYVDLLARDNS